MGEALFDFWEATFPGLFNSVNKQGAYEMNLTNEQMIEIQRRMLRIRRFEEKVLELVDKGELAGGAHLSIGQEGEIVGASMALRPEDYEMGTHRSHGHPIAKGSNLKPLMAELLGRKTGVNHGKSGSMHLADFSVGSLGETSIVGSGLPVAAGAALGAKMLGTGRVIICFFGDCAANQGTFHEALNLAAIWKLPVIYLCENNGYGVTTASRDTVSVKDIAVRAASYDIPGVVVDGQDPIAVYEVVSKAADRAREGSGPSLIEAKTYRYRGHAAGVWFDILEENEVYRKNEEVEQWRKRDPILMFQAKLIETGVLTKAQADQLDQEVQEEVLAAETFAKESPWPEAHEVYENLYSNPISA
jgi:pyruvate dehydrogenase E1 component alpha subunit